MHPLHIAAREYAAKGIPVFPCLVGEKKPACEHGFHDATTDLAQIDLWWSEAPYNIAFSPHTVGLGIIDLDGRDARETWELLQVEHGEAPETYMVQTPRGPDHLHLYFRGTLPTSVGASGLAEHIDTRGLGSYALLPPSRVGAGVYVALGAKEPADLPDWVLPLLDKKREKVKAAVDTLDLPANVARAADLLRRYVRDGKVAVLGHAGDHTTYQIACEVMNLGLSPDETFKQMWDLWAPHAQPFEPERFYAFLERKVANAAEYAQNEPGAFAVQSGSDTFAGAVAALGLKEEAPKRSRFYPLDEYEQATMPEPTWIIPGWLPDYGLTMMYGDRETYKSFLALDISLTLAAGLDYNDLHKDRARAASVVYVAGEGPRSVSHQRRPAWRIARGINDPLPFYLIPEMPLAARGDFWEDFTTALAERDIKPRLIVLDTLSRAMAGMNENDAKDASTFIEKLDELKRQFNCGVLVLHHATKSGEGGARGSSVLEGSFDAVYRVEAEHHVRAVKVTCTKMKDADHPKPRYFEMRQIGPSIVPFPVTDRAFKLLAPTDDKGQQKAVMNALKSLGATSSETGVATHVLASVLLPESPDQSPEDRAEDVERAARSLRARSNGSLAAYATGSGQALLWFLG